MGESTESKKPTEPNSSQSIDVILSQNKAWKASITDSSPDFFKKLASGHHPKFLWIGCADARVPANELMGEPAGSVFVHRNVGNQVLSTDTSLLATLQYAVDYLKIPDIIVCGHYDCGAVKAASANKDHLAPLENWLTSIRDVKRIHRTELTRLSDPADKHRRLVELNVVESCLNLFKTSTVQRARTQSAGASSSLDRENKLVPRIHALVFDPADGELRKLQVNFKALIQEYGEIYDIYGKRAQTTA